VGDGSWAAPRDGEMWGGGHGAGVAVGCRGFAGSGLAAAHTGGMRPALKQGRGETDEHALAP
jgi:hypothetical protein